MENILDKGMRNRFQLWCQRGNSLEMNAEVNLENPHSQLVLSAMNGQETSHWTHATHVHYWINF